jgi:hypothetical protein
MRIAALAAPAALALLQACAQPAAVPSPPKPVVPEGQCNSAGAAFAVGHAAGEALVSQAGVRAGAARVRILRPGQMVTQEFDASRLNLEVDAGGRVIRVRCG